jgi:4-amino-4-deoxy-L-arabinose transferase-like glycosyltransferase
VVMQRSLGNIYHARVDSLFQNRYLVVAVIFTLGLVLRLGWMIYSQPIPVSDWAEYYSLAKGLLQHKQFGYPEPSAYRLPAYPVFLAILMAVNQSTIWLSFCNVVLSALLVVIVYHVAYKLTSGDKLAATMSGLACAIYPTFIFFAPVLASEHLFAVLLFSSILALYWTSIGALTRTALSGLLLGTAVLTRGEALFYLPVLLVLACLPSERWRHRPIMSVLLVAVCGMAAASWYVRNLSFFGRGIGLTTTAGMTFYHGHNQYTYGWHPVEGTDFEGLDDVASQKLGYKLGWDYLKADPKRLLKNIVKGTKGLYMPQRFNYGLFWSLLTPKARSEMRSGEESYIWPLLSRLWFVRVLAFLFYGGLLLAALLSIVHHIRYSGNMLRRGFLGRRAIQIYYRFGSVYFGWHFTGQAD